MASVPTEYPLTGVACGEVASGDAGGEVASGDAGGEPTTEDDEGELTTGELFWRDRYEWLSEQGYMLRPRYNPDWVPSWIGTTKLRFRCEDGKGALVCCAVYFFYDANQSLTVRSSP